jgi:hypothetical protein
LREQPGPDGDAVAQDLAERQMLDVARENAGVLALTMRRPPASREPA